MAIALLLQQTAQTSREQLREQIRQSIQDATQAAKEAAAQANADARAAQGAGHNITLPVPPLPPLPPGQSGTTVYDGPQIPQQVQPISIAFFAMIAIIIVGLPLMRAIARRIDRGTPVAAPIPRAVTDQLQQISQSVDAIAIEVERISEGQRFTTKMLAGKQSDITMMTPGSASRP